MLISKDRLLFIFEMANNHMGDVEHGLKIIREFSGVAKDFDFDFAVKLQFRHLDTFIHPDFSSRKDFKYITRFSETRLSEEEFRRLRNAISDAGFISVCTPFDERSVDLIDKLNFDIIKIASCSCTDWPLLERAVQSDKPVIVSTGGAEIDELDRVVSFLEHRGRDFALLHCVGEYPTQAVNLELNQIELLKERYPGVPIGYSNHEAPEESQSLAMAIAKGAMIFERHVGVPTDTIKLNPYSIAPEHARKWLNTAVAARAMCGVQGKRKAFSEKEKSTLRDLRRAAFAARPVRKGEILTLSDITLAIPALSGQVTANDLSKYTQFEALRDIAERQPVLFEAVRKLDLRERVLDIVKRIRALLTKANVVVSGKAEFEISHHYGMDRFDEFGMALITVVNRSYCKKLLVLLPGQKHPEQYHNVKEETFHILFGEMTVWLDGVEHKQKAGDIMTVEPGVRHAMCSAGGAIIEEISSSHCAADSFYTDPLITENKNRKTAISYWLSPETEQNS